MAEPPKVPDWMSKTHLMRGPAASTAKARGVGEIEHKEHGCWSVPMGGAAHNRAFPNLQMTWALSGRQLNCVAIVTPRLIVPVPTKLNLFVRLGLEAEEKAYSARVASSADAADDALKHLSGLIR